MIEEELFAQALELPHEERGEFLREACGRNQALHKKLDRLLAQHERTSSILDEPCEDSGDLSMIIAEARAADLGLAAGECESSLISPGGGPIPFGDYTIEKEIGRGAMGIVYRARQESLKRTVAVKMIRSTLLTDREDIARFKMEAEAAASLDHPNIVPIYEIGEHEDQHYFSMRLIEDGTLKDRLEEFRSDQGRAVSLMATVARAVHAAHQRGVLHRDIKPGNILIDGDGEPHLTDFGLAKQIESNSSMTLSGQILGTPFYMAPEQAESGGKTLTTAADIYSLGAVIYELLTGTVPHRGESLVETLRLVAGEEPKSPRTINATISRDLEAVCLKCLEKEPARRYPSAEALADDLQRVADGRLTLARPVTKMEQLLRWGRRHAIALSLLILALVLCIGIRASFVRQRNATRAESLVDSLITADVTQLPTVISDLGDVRRWSTPLLHERLGRAEEGSAEKIHLSLALLPVDESQVDYLRSQLPDSTLDQFTVLREALAPYGQSIASSLWETAQDEEATASERFQATAAIARFAPDDGRWQDIAPFVSRYLTDSVPLAALSEWTRLLRPARSQLSDNLMALHMAPDGSAHQKESVSWILANYLRDQPEQLVEAIGYADQQATFSPLLDALRPHTERVREQLFARVRAEVPEEATSLQRDSHWSQQSLAAVALVQLGFGEQAWQLLRFTPDPSLRSFVIAHLGALSTDPLILARRLEIEPDVSARRALIQSLGALPPTQIPKSSRERIAAQLLELYSKHPDPGIHGSVAWTLQQWSHALPDIPSDDLALTITLNERLTGLREDLDAATMELADYERNELPLRQAEWEQRNRDAPRALPDSLDAGLVAYYPLDKADEGILPNLAGRRQEGRLVGSAGPTQEPGVLGTALNLTESGGRINCGNWFSPDSTDPLSCGCWFYIPKGKSRGVVMGKYDNTADRGFAVNVDPERNEVLCEWTHQFPYNTIVVRGKIAEIANRWHHLLVTYDGSTEAKGLTIYLDGRAVDRSVEYDSLSKSIRNEEPLCIGARGTTWQFRGLVDDVRVYDRELTAGETEQLFTTGLQALARVPTSERSEQLNLLVTRGFRARDGRLQELTSKLRAAEGAWHDAVWNEARRWFVNREGQTMVAIERVAEDSGRHLFAIASREVTVREFRRFQRDRNLNPGSARDADTPMNHVSWYEAAEYCNWLSDLHEIPEDQWVYVPNDDGDYDEGMKIRDNHLELRGYRLPIEAEWEAACRAGTRATYSCGEPVEILGRYCHHALNSHGRSQPVGILLPNEAGLFDMHGNVWEWIQDPGSGPISPVEDSMVRMMRGGAFNDPPRLARSVSRSFNRPDNPHGTVGFRPVVNIRHSR
jgi:tRNA A-37 threonylcarbamoyl transferase component Bud32